jgi:hypothetical protein
VSKLFDVPGDSQVCLMPFFSSFGSLNGEGDDFISTWDEVHETFDVMGLHENLLRGIYAYGMGLSPAVE